MGEGNRRGQVKPKLIPTKTPGIYLHVSTKGMKTYIYRYREPGSRASKQATFKTETEAKRFKRDLETAKDQGSHVKPSAAKITLSQWWDIYIKKPTWHRLTPSSKRWYEDVWRLHIKPDLGDRKLGSITRSDVEPCWQRKRKLAWDQPESMLLTESSEGF